MIRKLLVAVALTIFVCNGYGQPKSEKSISEAVERFRKAMVDPDSATLSALLDEKLSYGHSDGHVDTKPELITKISSGTYDFIGMDLANFTIVVSGKLASVRSTLDGKTNDNGKPGEAHLYVLMVWQKKHGSWKLFARQAVKQAVKPA